MSGSTEKRMLGWREWIAIPALGINRIKAKVDTGARTSALHAFYIEPFTSGGREWVRFGVHPEQQVTDLVIECEAPVIDRRNVADSGGHREERYVIEAELIIGEATVTTEVTLTDRDTMKFRMLLGRTAMRGIFTVDPAASYLSGVIAKTL
ncbi:MAG: ATP-dependent zinc protease [Gammaproteobacteria bacterium]|nr:ATP-dependent zinc protease [Gammaproteobacteria bacterium]